MSGTATKKSLQDLTPHARAVLSLLIMAILDDSPPTDELVIDTLEGLNAILTVD